MRASERPIRKGPNELFPNAGGDYLPSPWPWKRERTYICNECVAAKAKWTWHIVDYKPPPAPRALHLLRRAGKSKNDEKDYSAITGAFHRMEIGERKIGQIAATGEPMLIANVTGSEPWIADVAWIRREGIKSFAGQPLIFRGETLGVLAVFSRTAFSQEEFRWLRTFANHAAVAIADARAFDELNRLKKQLEDENEYLHEEIRETLHSGEIVAESAPLKKVLEQVALVAETNATVLIQGESGTGKELIARAIHDRSGRRTRPFIKVNCGAIPDELFESEFFGHVKRAFTGALKDRAGRFELADTGDLFLDEIAEIPLGLQSKLLRVLQEKQFERVGEGRTRTVDVRVIGATNRDLRRDVEEGRFREDLYYRLSVFPIELPPLRARREDIPILAQHFLKKSAAN
jgi:transcriptional regulator with GAF, ATPase, and Fis domain